MSINISDIQFQNLLDKYVREAEAEMRRRMFTAGLSLTGDTVASFKVSAQERGKDYINQVLSFSGVVRLKDMRNLHYLRTPPLAAMEYYVEKLGVRTFAYVPGYKAGHWPSTDSIAIRRIALAMKFSKKSKPDVKRGYRGIYNDVVFKSMPALRSQVAQAGAILAIREVQSILQNK